ncbi:hypothetical protein AM1_5590 [Acaryochloris marina MBIC11017]|uniref:Uncharacterized protein n=1 Tax=Acaryochloris marina (strain MBIC 11017) TaxID=329726 RepID=B0CF25_ACAM1|nr:hypothetical protein AM1_5590 [Acaryochloris marina MBIC11017]
MIERFLFTPAMGDNGVGSMIIILKWGIWLMLSQDTLI